jgi:hypothetical protein
MAIAYLVLSSMPQYASTVPMWTEKQSTISNALVQLGQRRPAAN